MAGLADCIPLPHTEAARRALRSANDAMTAADLAFLEAWEMQGPPGLGAILRAGQIRRANPDLAAAIRAELAGHAGDRRLKTAG